MRTARALCLLAAATLPVACAPAPPDGSDGVGGAGPEPAAGSADWSVYRGSPGGHAYSPLAAIDRGNVDRLEVAWTFRAGEADDGTTSTIQTNPLLIDGVLFVVSPRSTIWALDPATGESLWSFDPEPSSTIRGLSYWEDGEDRRLLVPIQRFLYALDPEDGSLIEGFGEGGRVDTRHGLGRDPDSVTIWHSSPGVVYEDLIILGSGVGEGYHAAPGHVRAYDVRTGEMRWIFHTIPHPGELGHETWPADAYRRVGGANAWSGVTLDEERGLAFVATGSAGFDFYGGYRKGRNLFANSVIALDARTGERRWHFQTVHHDLWDYDLPVPPTLVTVERGGRRVDAVAQATKTGFLFVLDRETGEPLFPVEERPVPASDVPGEEAWPTQPVPTRPAPFVEQDLTEEDLSDVSPEARRLALETFRRLEAGPIFMPPSLEGILFRPGTWGGAEWNGTAYDPETGLLYVNAHEVPTILQLLPPIEVGEDATLAEVGRGVYEANGCSGCHGADRAGTAGFPSLRQVDQRLSRSEIEEVVRGGRGAMPAFTNLTGEAMDALLAFLRGEDVERGAVDVPAAGGGGDADAAEADDGRRRYTHNGYIKFWDQQRRPAVDPPWGTLSAIDLSSGEYVWRIPLGEHPAAPDSIQPTGTVTFGGGVVTAGGLVFIGATADEKFRALDKSTGEILWEHPLPYGGYATPAVYEHEGKQYVVIAAGGGGRSGTPSGDVYVAFALP